MTPIFEEMKSSLSNTMKTTCDQENSNVQKELKVLENHLQQYIDNRFLQLQQHIDNRLDRLEKQLTSLNRIESPSLKN